ncbi:CBO2463/CBO2479 domain-containing protein [Anaerosalibacter bizertensis]|uniref:CBO2463/CBO2479 domain-containing protein n=1 Tax=Anaerosalibacter bizertensis TaxID=932217 RepID=UPI0035176A70
MKEENFINQNYFQGKITDISDGGIEIEFSGRLGNMRIPKRMLISDKEPKVGSEVGFMMTYPEVLE